MTVADGQRVKRELLLRSLFPTMPAAAHVRFIELLEDVDLAAGELAFEQGDPPDRFLFLTEGRVALESRAACNPSSFPASPWSGVVDAVLERPRQRACRALEASKALRHSQRGLVRFAGGQRGDCARRDQELCHATAWLVAAVGAAFASAQ